VARIEAHPQALRFLGRGDDLGQVLELPAEAAPLPCRILKQDFRPTFWQSPVHFVDRGGHPRNAVRFAE
jgi:hypothetical protein